ncbi:hypothetical protein CROQUDRAFT_657650, partial [Cronartium quercuum f. sp. fusiforme G11]
VKPLSLTRGICQRWTSCAFSADTASARSGFLPACHLNCHTTLPLNTYSRSRSNCNHSLSTCSTAPKPIDPSQLMHPTVSTDRITSSVLHASTSLLFIGSNRELAYQPQPFDQRHIKPIQFKRSSQSDRSKPIRLSHLNLINQTESNQSI